MKWWLFFPVLFLLDVHEVSGKTRRWKLSYKTITTAAVFSTTESGCHLKIEKKEDKTPIILLHII